MEGRGLMARGVARHGRLGKTWRVLVRFGGAGKAGSDRVCRGMARQVRHGAAGQGGTWSG
jgi:hypothetical protein